MVVGTTFFIDRVSKYQVFGKNVWNVLEEGMEYSTLGLDLLL